QQHHEAHEQKSSTAPGYPYHRQLATLAQKILLDERVSHKHQAKANVNKWQPVHLRAVQGSVDLWPGQVPVIQTSKLPQALPEKLVKRGLHDRNRVSTGKVEELYLRSARNRSRHFSRFVFQYENKPQRRRERKDFFKTLRPLRLCGENRIK